jgi:hypothetical protein
MPVILPGIADSLRGYPVRMAQVQVFADVPHSADRMWRELSSFQGIARWHPMVKVINGDGEQKGATRTLETVDGLRWQERLTERDTAQRLYRYEVTSADLPIADFRGEFRVREARSHRCTVIWTAQFTVTSEDEKTVSDSVRALFRAGSRALEKQYAAPPVTVLWRRLRTLSRRR